jgi:hypothetical protein
LLIVLPSEKSLVVLFSFLPSYQIPDADSSERAIPAAGSPSFFLPILSCGKRGADGKI